MHICLNVIISWRPSHRVQFVDQSFIDIRLIANCNSNFIRYSTRVIWISETMKLSILNLFCLLSAFLLVSKCASGQITIQIEPDDLENFSEILINHLYQHQVPQMRTSWIGIIKTVSKSVLQLFGVMITLVGANLLTSKLDPYIATSSTGKYQIFGSASVCVYVNIMVFSWKYTYVCIHLSSSHTYRQSIWKQRHESINHE